MKLLLMLFCITTLLGCDSPDNKKQVDLTEFIDIIPQSQEERDADSKLEEIHKSWIGTPWAYSGTSQIAGEGSIACGYFVTTTLRDAGMEVDRVRLAQVASEKMILEITDRKTVRRFSNQPLDEVLKTIKKQGEGYYIVGLDTHTGFLRVAQDGVITFIHSRPGRGVVFDKPEKSTRLASSRYRVTGKIVWGASAEQVYTADSHPR